MEGFQGTTLLVTYLPLPHCL